MSTRSDRFMNYRLVYRQSPLLFLQAAYEHHVPIRRALLGVGPSLTATMHTPEEWEEVLANRQPMTRTEGQDADNGWALD